MNDSLPRDAEGYVDLDQLPDVETTFDPAAFAETPPLDSDVWDAMVTRAPYSDLSDGSSDTDTLLTAPVDHGPLDQGPMDSGPELVDDSTWSPSAHETPAADDGAHHPDTPDNAEGGDASGTDW